MNAIPTPAIRRILVLCEGRLTGEFSRTEATEQKIMEAATQREVLQPVASKLV